jgi:benzoate membrane transport protein
VVFERGAGFKGSLQALKQDVTLTRLSLGFTAFLFAATGPLVILLTSANQAKLPFETTVSWIFTVYLTSGIGMIFMSLYYRQPIVVAWSIPGAALVGDGLLHNAFSDVLGAYLVVALALVILGITGAVRRVMEWLPIPVLMGMVAAVLLPYALAVFTALVDIPFVAGPALLIYLFLTAFPHLGRRFPPVLCTIVVALLLASFTGATNWGALEAHPATPVVFFPTFNLATIIELAPPLLIAVIAIQNGQGIAVLLSQGFKPPINAMTTVCGVGSLVNLIFGGHSTCIAGPSVAIIANPEAGDRKGRYTGATTQGFFWIVFGLFAPVAASIERVVLKKSLIPMLGGMAMLSVLTGAFQAAFGGKFKTGALFSFLITFSNIKIAGIGSAFWGLAGGMFVAYLLDRADFLEMIAHVRQERATRQTEELADTVERTEVA